MMAAGVRRLAGRERRITLAGRAAGAGDCHSHSGGSGGAAMTSASYRRRDGASGTASRTVLDRNERTSRPAPTNAPTARPAGTAAIHPAATHTAAINRPTQASIIRMTNVSRERPSATTALPGRHAGAETHREQRPRRDGAEAHHGRAVGQQVGELALEEHRDEPVQRGGPAHDQHRPLHRRAESLTPACLRGVRGQEVDACAVDHREDRREQEACRLQLAEGFQRCGRGDQGANHRQRAGT